MRYFIFEAGRVVEAEQEAWLTWRRRQRDEGSGILVVEETALGPVKVKTEFIGMVCGNGPPILWETMIFGSSLDLYQERYGSLETARVGHRKAVSNAIWEMTFWGTIARNVRKMIHELVGARANRSELRRLGF